jgi:RNA polymerase sigma factor (sigma-70 family)
VPRALRRRRGPPDHGVRLSEPGAALAVADAHRHEWAFVLAATVRVTLDIDLAEECVQDAYAQALHTWTLSGVPTKPGAWLTTVARRRALDILRRESTLRRKLPLLLDDDLVPEVVAAEDIADDRLRLIFTCCHPALAPEAQIALTLRLLCGLSTAEVARAFLQSEPTMAARITRAKKKIATARIPYRVPSVAELPARVDAVLAVIHLMFTTGHTAPAGSGLLRHDLVDRAVDMARMLNSLVPGNPDVLGLLALILLTDARRATRVDSAGRLVLLEDADRSRWDQVAIGEGAALVRVALSHRPPSRYALQAAIAAVHSTSVSWADTDFHELVGLYRVLERSWPSPVVALNLAVAVGLADGPAAGLSALDALGGEPLLAGYGYLPAARADFLRRLGRISEARQAYEEALLLTENAVERAFLTDRLNDLH